MDDDLRQRRQQGRSNHLSVGIEPDPRAQEVITHRIRLSSDAPLLFSVPGTESSSAWMSLIVVVWEPEATFGLAVGSSRWHPSSIAFSTAGAICRAIHCASTLCSPRSQFCLAVVVGSEDGPRRDIVMSGRPVERERRVEVVLGREEFAGE